MDATRSHQVRKGNAVAHCVSVAERGYSGAVTLRAAQHVPMQESVLEAARELGLNTDGDYHENHDG